MPLPCNNVSVTPIKVSQLVRYSNLDGNDLLLTVESGSLLWSRRSTINDLKSSLGRLTGSYSGSFTGSFKGISSGSFSGSYWGKVISKNTVASGSFSGSYWGRILSKNTVASGSFSGSHYGKVIGSNGSLITGSFRGIDNITNFRGTGKKVSFNGTASYAVSSSYALTASSLSLLGSGTGSPLAFAHACGTPSISILTDYNVDSMTMSGTQPVSVDGGFGRYRDVVFTTPAGTSNYTVLAYCSWDNPALVAANGSGIHFADIGTVVVSNRSSTGFTMTTFAGWYVGSADDGDDYWSNTSLHPDYISFVAFK